MTLPTSAALSAYQSTANLVDTISQGQNQASSLTQSIGENFEQFLSQTVENVTAAGKSVETQTLSAVQGQGDMIDVVTAVAETEVALQSMVSMRDRVIQSYEEIMRMPI